MKKLITLFTLTLLISNVCLAQKDDVYDELESAFSYAKQSTSYANDALDYIKKCYSADSLDDIQYYARKAKNEIDDAKSQASYASSDASDAEDEADDIDCDDAEDEADDAESDFYSAQSDFDDAYTYLRRAEYSDEVDDIEYNLRRAKSSIEDGLNDLGYGLSNLNDAVDELNNCY